MFLVWEGAPVLALALLVAAYASVSAEVVSSRLHWESRWMNGPCGSCVVKDGGGKTAWWRQGYVNNGLW